MPALPADMLDTSATQPQRTYAMWCHLAGLIVGAIEILSDGHVEVISFVAPMILWLSKREESPFIDDHGREALNFQLSCIAYRFVGWGLFWVSGLWVPLRIIALLNVVATIMAAHSANQGRYFRYPACLRFVRSH